MKFNWQVLKRKPVLLGIGGAVLVALIFIRNISADDANVMDMTKQPLALQRLEEISVEYTATGTLQDAHALLLVGTGIQPAPGGNIITMRGTSVTAATPFAWSTLAVTWPDSLPDGLYACVGIVTQSATAIASRLIFNGQSWRPGGVSIPLLTSKSSNVFMNGNIGELGRFEQTALPQVEVLCQGADAVHVSFLQFVRVG